MDKRQKIFIGVISLVVIILILVAVFSKEKVVGPGKLDNFAQCLKDSGATFYGAFWCPHCNNQKKLFGSSKSLLPYVECSLPNGSGQTQICIDKNISGYPTWEFADGSRPFSGEVSLEDLSAKTGCPLPEGENAQLEETGGTSSINPVSETSTETEIQ